MMDALTAMKQALEALDFACDNWIGSMSSAGMRDARSNLRAAIKKMENEKPVAWLNLRIPHMAVLTKPTDGGGWFPVYLKKKLEDIK